MKILDYNKGLRVYGVYKFKKHPYWDIVCTGLEEKADKLNSIKGLAFDELGKLVIMVNLNLPLLGEEVGYVYDSKDNYSLVLNSNKRSVE